jgi:hypothetical protein
MEVGMVGTMMDIDTTLIVGSGEKLSASEIGSKRSVMLLSKQGETRSAAAEKRSFVTDTSANGKESANARGQFERCALPDFRRANRNVPLKNGGADAKI